MIIALDGPAASGKSTIARELAKCMGMRYLDSGAMYRAVTLLALEAGLLPDRIEEAAEMAAKVDIRLEDRSDDLSRVFVDGREVTEEIRGPLVTRNVSAVSAEPGVRAVLTEIQRREASRGDVVLEGRDIGTVVCPHADLKIFLTATVEERARRRRLQMEAKGVTQSQEELIAEIEARDAYDSGREVAPLRKAEDAVEVDTTGLSIAEVVHVVCREAESRGFVRPADPVPRRWSLCRMVRSPLDSLLYRFAYSFIPTFWKLLFRMEIRGSEHIPLEGAVLLASNHRSNLDPFFLGASCPRQIHFMAKAELWKVGALGRVIEALGAFPVNRGEADRQAVRRALEVLEQGAVVGLFPEGHRQRAGGFGQINPGVTLFSLRDGVVTIPVVLEGTNKVMNGRIPRFPRVRVSFGAPLEIPSAQLTRSERSLAASRDLQQRFRLLAQEPRTGESGR